MVLNAVIVDDESRNIALFSYYLEKYCPNIKVEAAFTKKAKAVRHLISYKPDILFLDIVLDEGSGFDILDEINYENINVVMCTAHDEFALRAIRYQVVDYLLKPLEIQDLIATVNKIEKKLASGTDKQVFDASIFSKEEDFKAACNKRFPIADRYSIDFVPVDEILCIETQKGRDKVEITLENHKKGEFLVINLPITEVAKKLPENAFFRTGRSCIVCINGIASIHRGSQYTLTLTNQKRIPISRKGYKMLIAHIEKVYETKL